MVKIKRTIPPELLELRSEMVRWQIRPLDVAMRAGISPSVVSHVLSGAATSNRVMVLIRDMIAEKVDAKKCISSIDALQV